jgi:predicted PurR-regulated permease PerM
MSDVESANMTSDRWLRVSIGLCTAIISVTALYFSGPIFAPLAFALLIIAIIWPVQRRLQTRLPKLVALAVSMLATVVIITVFGSLIAWSFGRVVRYIVSDATRFQLLYGQMAEWLEGHGIVVAGLWAEHFNVGWLIRLFQQATIRLNSMLSFSLVVLVYVVLGLLEVNDAAGKLGAVQTGEFGRRC